MEEQTEPLRHYLIRLGLDERAADIYTALKQYGPQTISELARLSRVPRTRIYRVFDELVEAGLIEVQTHHKRNILEAAPFSKVQVVLAAKEQELSDLRREYAGLVTQLDTQMMQTDRSRIYFYEGIEGIKQMLWLQTKYSGENLSILRDGMKQQVGLAFFERWSQACNEKNITFRSIIDDNLIATQNSCNAKHTNTRLDNWHARYVAREVFPINYSLVVFDNIVLHYNWDTQQKFGIAIHDKFIADMQRNVFEMLWTTGTSPESV
jgi:sugar-specific transcriptional regulator TrmB